MNKKKTRKNFKRKRNYKGGTLKNWFTCFLCKLPIIRDFDMCDMCHIKDNRVLSAVNKSIRNREKIISQYQSVNISRK
jgi:hypothetical protein